jgi:hypothetical protein
MARISLKKNKKTKYSRTRRQRQRRRQMRGGDFLDYFKPTVKDAAYCQAEFDKCNASINPDSDGSSIYPSFLTNLFGTKKDSTTSNDVEGEDQGIEMQEIAPPLAEPAVAAEGDFTNDLAPPLAEPAVSAEEDFTNDLAPPLAQPAAAAEDDFTNDLAPPLAEPAVAAEGDLYSDTNDTLDTLPVLSPAVAADDDSSTININNDSLGKDSYSNNNNNFINDTLDTASPAASPVLSPAASPVLSPADDDLYSTIPIKNDSIGKDLSYSNNNNFTNNELASAQNKKLFQNKNQILSPSMVSPVTGGGGSRKKYKKRNANRSKKNKNRRNKKKTSKRN